MLNKFIAIHLMAAVILCAGVSSGLAADEKLMVGWPKQRAEHTQDIADRAASYEARGKAYTEHLYATGGETSIDADMSVGEGLSQDIDPIPLNVGQIADMVKQSAGDGPQNADGTPVLQSPSDQAGATPQ